MSIDPNEKVPSPSHRTSSWAFIGYLKDGTSFPIGLWSDYRVGRLQADSWMSSTPKAERWEATILHKTAIEEEK